MPEENQIDIENYKKLYLDMVKETNPGYKLWYNEKTKETPLGLDLSHAHNKSEIQEIYYQDYLMRIKQTLAFCIELIPHLYKCSQTYGLNLREKYTLLDIGTSTGIGANFLGQTFSTELWGFQYKFIVDAMDISDAWKDYWKLLPFINNAIVCDLFNIAENTYDICFCSHTIEHIDTPEMFVKQAKKVAKEFAFFSCPFEERDPIPGHKTISREFVESLNPWYFTTYKSVNRWHESLECVIFAI